MLPHTHPYSHRLTHTHTDPHTHRQNLTHTHSHTQTHTRTHTLTNTHTHSNTYTHTLRHAQNLTQTSMLATILHAPVSAIWGLVVPYVSGRKNKIYFTGDPSRSNGLETKSEE